MRPGLHRKAHFYPAMRTRVAESVGKRLPLWIWLVVALALSLLLLRTRIADLYLVSSDSMIPTLLPGDRLLVVRHAAGQLPKRGDVIVFSYPREPQRLYVKRVIGLPGEKITYHGDRLAVDDEAFSYRRQGSYAFPDGDGPFKSSRADSYIERFAGRGYRILERPEPLHAPGSEWHVPDAHVFLLGDNRDSSNDSRFLGTVSTDDIVGTAYRVLWSEDGGLNDIRWSRTWQPID